MIDCIIMNQVVLCVHIINSFYDFDISTDKILHHLYIALQTADEQRGLTILRDSRKEGDLVSEWVMGRVYLVLAL